MPPTRTNANRFRLRVFHAPEEGNQRDARSAASVEHPNRVTIPVGDVLPLLADAAHDDRTWLRDFIHDEVTVSTDLYEVLLAYQFYRRPSA